MRRATCDWRRVWRYICHQSCNVVAAREVVQGFPVVGSSLPPLRGCSVSCVALELCACGACFCQWLACRFAMDFRLPPPRGCCMYCAGPLAIRPPVSLMVWGFPTHFRLPPPRGCSVSCVALELCACGACFCQCLACRFAMDFRLPPPRGCCVSCVGLLAIGPPVSLMVCCFPADIRLPPLRGCCMSALPGVNSVPRVARLLQCPCRPHPCRR